MNNCIVQGKIVNMEKVKFCYYESLKAVLVIHISFSGNMCNIIECRIYDNDIDIFLDKYILNNICILVGSLKNNKGKYNKQDYILVKEIY